MSKSENIFDHSVLGGRLLNNAAELMKLTDAGTIAVRKSSDFVVLDANPLDDITNTRRISSVYLRGSQVDRTGLRARWTSGRTSQ